MHSTLCFDIRYATADNFVSRQVYPFAKAYLLEHVAVDLLKVHASLEKQGFGLLIYDGYRPWHVTKIFWDVLPPEKRKFVADPAKGSVHNRGCAVDLSIFHLRSGKPCAMPSDFDETTDRAAIRYEGGTEIERFHRDLCAKKCRLWVFKGLNMNGGISIILPGASIRFWTLILRSYFKSHSDVTVFSFTK